MHDITKIGNARIRRALRSKRGRRIVTPEAPAKEKGKWAAEALLEENREEGNEGGEEEAGKG